MLDECIELYHATESCKQGKCANCSRKNLLNSSNNYSCKSKLLNDCNLMFSKLIDMYCDDLIIMDK